MLSFLFLRNEEVEVSGIGKVKFDVAYGGAFYAFPNVKGTGISGKEFAKKAEVFSMDINYFGPRKKNVRYKEILH